MVEVSMVERVARAIFFQGGEQDDKMWQHMQEHLRDGARRDARNAIEAMREPTDAMTFKGQSLRYERMNSIGQIWREMIDASLLDSPHTKGDEA